MPMSHAAIRYCGICAALRAHGPTRNAHVAAPNHGRNAGVRKCSCSTGCRRRTMSAMLTTVKTQSNSSAVVPPRSAIASAWLLRTTK